MVMRIYLASDIGEESEHIHTSKMELFAKNSYWLSPELFLQKIYLKGLIGVWMQP